MRTSLKIKLALAGIIILLSIALCFFMTQNNANKKRLASMEQMDNGLDQRFEPVIDTIFQTIIHERDTTILKYQIIKRNQHNNVVESTINPSYLDSLTRALNVGKDAVTEVNRIVTQLNKKLHKKDLIIADLKNKETANTFHWKTKNADIIANLEDSTAIVKYDAKITVTDYSKKPNWFTSREYYTAISTDDEDLKINGVQMYEQKANVKCSKIGIGIQTGYGAVYTDHQFKLAPYVGFGLNWKVF